jgi:hypothetical protein
MRTYVVKFWGGGGGWFVQQLIATCELDQDESDVYPQGHAHNFGLWVNATYDNTDQLGDQYRVKPSSLVNFIVVRGDDAATIQRIYTRSPEDFRMINIVSERPLDVALAEYNHFYKNQIYGTQDYALFPHYQQHVDPQATQHPVWRQVTTEQMIEVFKSRTRQRWRDPDSNDLRSSRFYSQLNRTYAIPNHEISIQAVMTAGDELLNLVSDIVGRPINDAMRRNCQAYAEGQRAMRSRWPAYNILKSTYEGWRPD